MKTFGTIVGAALVVGLVTSAFGFDAGAATGAAFPAPARPGATPATPAAPPPELCTAPARTLDETNALIAAAVASPQPASGAGGAEPRRDVVPAGTPADPATVAEVEAVVRAFVACFNAGELLRAYGLYADPALGRLFARQGPFTDAAFDALATPLPAAADERAAIVSIHDTRLLPDGRAGATVTIAYAVVPMPKTFFFTFVRAEGRWLIDGVLGEISFSVP